jgi:hypothetical protein
MKKLILTGMLVLFFGLDCSAQEKDKQSKLCITEQEYKVYDAAGVGNFQNETNTYPLGNHIVAELGDVSPETIANFNERNDRAYSLRCVERPGGKTAKLRRSKGGNASTSFSRIGFNRDWNEALVYHYSQAVGNYCRGDFVLLRKKADGWEVVRKVMTVIC